MSDLFLQPRDVHVEAEGKVYVPHIRGAERRDGTWEAWIEFQPIDGGPSLATACETTQPNRGAVEYWATGLEPVYYEGALLRASRVG